MSKYPIGYTHVTYVSSKTSCIVRPLRAGVMPCIGSDISNKSLKRKLKHQRPLQFNQRVKQAF